MSLIGTQRIYSSLSLTIGFLPKMPLLIKIKKTIVIIIIMIKAKDNMNELKVLPQLPDL
jgi:hypothetical protein